MNAVRMMSPDGKLGDVPAERVAEAQTAGFRVMSDADLREMYQRLFMQHTLFQQQRKQPLTSKRSIVRFRGPRHRR